MTANEENRRTIIVRDADAGELDLARRLMREYVDSLGLDLSFQGFEEEMAGLPGGYAPPGGALFLAFVDGQAAGCAAVRRLGDGTAEMKRLFVRDAYRGLGLGSALGRATVERARELGYRSIKLDTLSIMTAAIALYRSLGFREVEAYRHNPLDGAKYFELELSGA